MAFKSPCSCIGGDFFLSVSSPSNGVVLIHDLSKWIEGEGNFVPPGVFILEVTYPGGQVEFVEVIGGFVVLDDEKVVDGVYQFRLDNCGVVYSQRNVILSGIRCSLDKMWMKQDEKLNPIIGDIENDVFVAEAAARVGNIKAAEKIISLIKIKIQNVSCDCKCG